MSRWFSSIGPVRIFVVIALLLGLLPVGKLEAQQVTRVRVLITRPGASLQALVPTARAVFFDEMRVMGLLPLPTDGGCEDRACAEQVLGLETADVALVMTEAEGNLLLTLVGEASHQASCADREEAGLRACLRELVRSAGIAVRSTPQASAHVEATAQEGAPLRGAAPPTSEDATPSWVLGASLTLAGVAALAVGIAGFVLAPSCVDSTCLQYERTAEVPSIAWLGTGAALVVAGSVFFGIAASTGPSGQVARATLRLHF